MRSGFVVVAAFVAIVAACLQGGHEGDRCNPDLSHDECNDGLSCQQPKSCDESYCCPANLAASKSSSCRSDPDACPLDAGSD
jgi:hypothetical protein